MSKTLKIILFLVAALLNLSCGFLRAEEFFSPRMPHAAVQFLERHLKKKPNAQVLEFGSGRSTIWFAKRTKNLYSIEHDRDWYRYVTDELKAHRGCHPVKYYFLKRPYFNFCQKFPSERFDLIIIDGRERVKCLQRSMRILRKGGVLLLDDSQRKRYRSAFSILKDWKRFDAGSSKRKTSWWIKPSV